MNRTICAYFPTTVVRTVILMLGLCGIVVAAHAESFVLPPPQKTGGASLMDALTHRSTARAFDTRDIPLQELSNLLWATWGVNRPDGRRTAPSARNAQETDVYVLTCSGAFRYDAAGHRLEIIGDEDIRALGGAQPFVKDAPVTLVYVVDLSRMGGASVEERKLIAHADVGFIAQNACLYCAGAGFVTGIRMMIDRTALAPKLKLNEQQLIVLAQSVGYPKP